MVPSSTVSERLGRASFFGSSVADLGLNTDFQDLLIAFADARAEYLLVGGWALALHLSMER